MSSMSAPILVSFFALAAPALATLGATYPVASTVCTGGQACGPFTWEVMDSVSPPAADFGRTSVGIYTGSVNQQTLFLDLGTVADPTSVLQLDAARIPASLGSDGDFYFLRFESESAIDPATGFPLQAFSAKFTLTGMTGQLTPEASAQINGVALAPTSSARGRTSSSAAAASTTSAGGIRAAAAAASSASSGPFGNNKNTTSTGSSSGETGAAFRTTSAAWTVSLAAGLAGLAHAAL